jgi:hypothetical protein
VTLPHVDVAESTDAINTFHFAKAAVTDNFTFIQEMVEDFYTRANAPNPQMVSQFLSPRIRRDVPATLRIYDDNALDPTGPVHEGSFPLLGALDNRGMIEEVALCASFHATPIAGVRKQSTSGRVYLGPLNHAAQELNTGRPSSNFLDVLRLAMIELNAASNSSAVGGHKWVVYSPTLDKSLAYTGPTDFPVVGGFVDNAFDTQRRRGLDPSTRVTWGT